MIRPILAVTAMVMLVACEPQPYRPSAPEPATQTQNGVSVSGYGRVGVVYRSK